MTFTEFEILRIFSLIFFQITLGRTAKGQKVDVDLKLEGPAWKISRRQGVIKLKNSGEFYITNEGKRCLFVDGKPVSRINLSITELGYELCPRHPRSYVLVKILLFNNDVQKYLRVYITGVLGEFFGKICQEIFSNRNILAAAVFSIQWRLIILTPAAV